ncbi:MAG TPA: sugar phosphate nucleotidyltransferase [Chloroflexota bacterium]|nr:sugar phosphate nucleotidyltransferase [Chloroflexota bacterium]
MKAVVMAGGEGSRLRPLTIGRPKPMVPIVNAPVMEHILSLLRRHGITEVVVTLQYLSRVIQEYFGDGSDFGMRISYTIEDTPLGTAGSVKNAEHLLDEPFLVISGDALTDFDLSEVIGYHRDKGSMATLTLYRVPSPLEYGVVILDRDGRVVRFLEKPSWGEVFSDTVNTGIYVLDPAIFRYVPSGVPVDWSNDVFPQLLRNGDPMFGFVAGGYWCDVGNITEYVRANADMLNELVKLPIPGREVSGHLAGGVWIAGSPNEDEASVDPSAKLYGPVFLGKGVEVRANAVIHGPSVIGDYTIVDSRATIDRSVVWPNCYVGENTDLHGALIGKQCSLKAGTVVFEGAVVGDNCTIGEGAIIRPNVKLWPNKEVEMGATVSASVIWSTQARRGIFSRSGVSGLANIEMVPEFAARLGAAYGTLFSKGSMVTANRDLSHPARMIKRAVMSGLLSAGIDVLDIGEVPVPVARFETRHADVKGGLHVRVSPDDPRQIDVKIFDGSGLNIDKSAERKVESTFFREDYRRVQMSEVGAIISVREPVVERYTQAFMGRVDRQAVARGRLRAVVDYGLGSTSGILPTLLGELSVEAITVNAATSRAFALRTPAQYEQDLRQLAAICRATGVHAGAMMDNDGKTIALVDDQGNVVPPMSALAAFAILSWKANPGSIVGVPVTAPHILEEMAATYGGRVRRLQANPEAQMRAAVPARSGAETPGSPSNVPSLIGDGQGSYIFPDFHPGFDGMMAVARLLQYLGQAGLRLSEVLSAIPAYYLSSAEAPCPWDAKGRVMRVLHEQAARLVDDVDEPSGATEQIEGVKFERDGEWALVLPDPDRPVFHVYAEAKSAEHASALAGKYVDLVKRVEGEAGRTLVGVR